MSPRVTIIVGAASGMGRATALRLGQESFAFGLADRDADRLWEVAEELRHAGIRNHAAALDLADTDAVAAGIEQLGSKLGTPWMLGISSAILDLGWVLDESLAHFDRVLRVGLLAVIAVNQAAARAMAAGGGGRIVNWSSISAVSGTAGASAYAAAKAGLDTFTRSLAVELGPYDLDQPAVDRETARTPLRRWGEPEDVAAVAAFLASDASQWLTGACIPVDGGTLANQGRPNVSEATRRAGRESR